MERIATGMIPTIPWCINWCTTPSLVRPRITASAKIAQGLPRGVQVAAKPKEAARAGLSTGQLEGTNRGSPS